MLCTVSAVICATLPTKTLTAQINEVQKKFGVVSATTTADKRSDNNVRKSEVDDTKVVDHNDNERSTPTESESSPKTKDKIRNDKMLDFYRYFAPAPAPTNYPMPYVPYYNPYYQQPYMSALYSPYYSGSLVDPNQTTDEYDEEYQDQDQDQESTNDVENDDDGSRANKRRPANAHKNSPIFYIRLPPTPYMYIPGMGYISQPPTIQPLTPQYPVNPFINLPITYLSNAKPTGVFPWNQQNPSNFATPQFPSYLPPRPQKPYRPKPQMSPSMSPSMTSAPTPTQDSKITHLGSYLFNGRPESIYLMPPYHNPYASPYHLPNPYQAAAPLPPSPYNTAPYNAAPYNTSPYNAAPYNAAPYNPYSPIYAPPALPSYY